MEKIDVQGTDIMKQNLAPQGVVEPVVETPVQPEQVVEQVEIPATPVIEAPNPFVNPLVEKINSIFKEGGDTKAIRELIDLSERDLDQMSPEDKIVMQYKSEFPNADEAKIRAWMEDQYGTSEDRTPAQEFALLKAGRDAEKTLADKKISLETYQNEAKVQAEQQAQKQFADQVNYWTPIVEKSFNPKVALQEGDWGMEFNLPDDAKAAIQQSMLNFSVNLPKGGDSLQKVEAFGKHMVWASYGEKILAAAIKDAVAKTTEQLKRSSVSVPPSGVPSVNVTPPTSAAASMLARETTRKH